MPLVNLYITCYNEHRKNVPGGIFPESSVIFIENNRSTGQSWAVISFWLSREYSLLPRRETQSRQSQTFRSPPFGGKKPPQVRGRSTFIIVYAHAKSQTYYRKACSEHALQTGFSFYPCCPSFPLVNQRTGCYNIDRRNASGGTFPNWFQLNMKNNRSTSQGRAVISFWLSRECSLLPRRETQSRQSQTFRSPPFGGKTPPFCLRTFLIHYSGRPHEKSNILSKVLFGAHTSNRTFILFVLP